MATEPGPRAFAAELAALVDALLPGDELFPSAAEVGVQWSLADRLGATGGEALLRRLTEALAARGGPLAPLDRAGREAVLARLEAEEAELFGRLRAIVYLGYYQSPAAAAAVRTLGFPVNATPLPGGYFVEPFDPARDTPCHGRGAYKRTDEVSRVDLSGLDFLVAGQTGHG